MIEYSYRGYTVQQRGSRHHVPALGCAVPSEPAARKAIDTALTPVLRVGDEVIWRGGFGADAPKLVTVRAIDLIDGNPDDGQPVSVVPWSEVRGRCVVVDLSTGQWAYGYQIERLPAEEARAA